MIKACRFLTAFSGGALLVVQASAQIPDLLNAYSAGGRAMGMGNSITGTDPSTQSILDNPASLGFLSAKQVGIVWGNLPNSTTSITNTRTDPIYDSQGSGGSDSITHFGFLTPMSQLIRNARGTIGLSYTVGGYVNDTAFGPSAGLPDPPLTINNYELRRSARADFYTLSYGIANPKQTASLGIGVTYVQQKVSYVESGTATDGSGNSIPFNGADVNFNAYGVGLILGGQLIPASTPNLSIGASVRSPIHLSDANPGGIYNVVPGRALLGASYRRDSIGGGDDFIVFGSQIEYFFGGDSSAAFDRSNQTDFGVGLEYDKAFSGWRLPIRIGYTTVGAGGDGFGSRNVFTYGFGYRPANGDYSIDLNWGSPEGGGQDFGISASYRFK